MKVTFEINTERTNAQELDSYRAAAAYLLHLAGDLQALQGAYAEDPDERASTDFVPPPPPPAPTGTTDAEGSPVVSNVVNFPVPPPPPPLVRTADVFLAAAPLVSATLVNHPVPPPPPAAPALPALASAETKKGMWVSDTIAFIQAERTAEVVPASTVAPEYDSANMPWDERIHQKDKNKKQDGTWKLRKQRGATVEQVIAFQQLVQEITQAHAARRMGLTVTAPQTVPSTAQISDAIGSFPVPPPPPMMTAAERVASLNAGQYPLPAQVPLPPTVLASSVTHFPPPPPPPALPMPPVSGYSSAPNLSVPPPPPPMLVQPVPAAGAVPAPPGQMTFRNLMDKLVAATQAGKITPQQAAKCCTDNGAPNLQQLSQMPHLIEPVNTSLDMVLAGLS